MCDFCIPIVGRGGMAHTVKDCAIKQSAHCPHCGPGTHFRSGCPKKRKPLSPNAPAIASIKSAKQPPHLYMSDSNQGYCEYLRQNGLATDKKPAENRAAVQKHLLTQEQPLVLVNPPAMNPVCSKEAVHCKEMHGDNVYCIPPPPPPPPKKKKLKLIVE